MVLAEKFDRLEKRIKGLGSVLVAYSGGVDSSFLLKVAHDILGDKVLAVTALSETYPLREAGEAKDFALTLGVRWKAIRTKELEDPYFRKNPPDRCYYCKKELFAKLVQLAKKNSLCTVIDGSNLDDLSDYRPGRRAKEEAGVVSPLSEVRLGKREIRLLSKRLGLATWQKPAMACLASRIPYNRVISPKKLARIDRAEEILRKVFKIRGNLRVRDFGTLARIEVDKKEIKKIEAPKKLVSLLGSLGYKNIVVDPKGYRCGSLNETLRKI